MKNRLIKVAGAVSELKVGDIDYNTEKIISLIKSQEECGVMVFPELTITGYTCADLFLSDLIIQRAKDALVKIAEETVDCEVTAVVGFPLNIDNNLYNCAAVISCGEIKAVIPKTYMPNYSEFYECR